MVLEKAASDLESTKISVQGTTIRKISLLSYAMRGGYTLELLAYGIHNRKFRLVELVEYISDKHVGKDRSHGTGLVNLYPGSRCQLMEPREVQKDIRTPGT